MIYHCDTCRAVLPGGTTLCPSCGKKFDSPVPIGSQSSAMENLLQGRTASGTFRAGQTANNLSNNPSNALLPANMPPAWYGTPPPARKSLPLWLSVTAAVAGLLAILSLAVWGVYALWMRGPGGEIAYRQHNLAGNAASERGDFRQADEEYGQMITLRPRRVDGYLLRGISEFQGGRNAAAIEDNTAGLALSREPTMRGDLFYNRAQAYARRGALTRAIADYSQAAREYARERNPQMVPQISERQAGTASLRADAYWRHKDYALAIADCSTAIAFGHPHPDDYGVRAKAESALGRDKAAQADFHQALRLDPSYLDGYVGLGDLAEKHHQPALAVAVFEQATRISPGTAQFWGSLGWFQYEAGQYPQAIVSDQHARSLDANQGWVTYNLALTYAAGGQGAQSQAAYADAVARSGPSERQAGLGDIRQALARQPASAPLRAALAQVERGGGGTGPAAAARLPVLPLPPPPSAPRPSAAFAARLRLEVAMNGYGIQPPLGYTLTQRRQVSLTSAGTVYLWSGPPRPDGTVPTLQVVIAQDDSTLSTHSTSAKTTQMALDAMQDNHSHVSESPVTSCTLGGLPFSRGDWSGTGQKTGKVYRGSEYWLVSPSSIVQLSTHDAVPYDRTTLPLLQASILTFRKI